MEFLGGNTQKDNVRAACKKCGYPGHLTFQCRNYLKIGSATVVAENNRSSSSPSPSEHYLTPLQELRCQEQLEEKAREEKKLKKATKKEKKKLKRKRRKSSSSSSTDSSDDRHHSRSKKRRKEKKKKSTRKKKSHKKPYSSSDSD